MLLEGPWSNETPIESLTTNLIPLKNHRVEAQFGEREKHSAKHEASDFNMTHLDQLACSRQGAAKLTPDNVTTRRSYRLGSEPVCVCACALASLQPLSRRSRRPCTARTAPLRSRRASVHVLSIFIASRRSSA